MARHTRNEPKRAKTCRPEEPSLLLGLFPGHLARMSGMRQLLVLALATMSGFLHTVHVGSMFENDRRFSHLSTLEREMTFRTEMGLYYSYFKTIVEAPTFPEGIASLYANNLTEYPSTINTLKRFNLYPEVALGFLFRTFESAAAARQWRIKTCWTVNRGENLSPVESCEGLGDPANFYISCIWALAGVTTFFLFLIGVELSNSILGGVMTILCFFYNHGECTRVQWTPPLRESFAFPIFMAQMFVVTLIMQEDKIGSQFRRRLKIGLLSGLSCSFIIVWQFAQFALLTQLGSAFAIFSLGLLSKDAFGTLLSGLLLGLGCSIVLMFGNEMLFTSWFSSFLFAIVLVTWMFEKFSSDSSSSNRLLRLISETLLVLVTAIALKLSVSKLMHIQDDAHIFEILLSKFSDFKNFHTQLYTCAAEFDFLGTEMPYKISWTLLLPCAMFVSLIVSWNLFMVLVDIVSNNNNKKTLKQIDAKVAYHFLQMLCFGVMAIIIMRLKLFWGPQLCILVSLMASEKIMSLFLSKREHQVALLFLIMALASVEGYKNIEKQRSIMGEYSNIPLEQLIDWINENIPKESSICGSMPVMANLLLSTRRPVINHPHYEDSGLREKTKMVYQIFSKKKIGIVHETLRSLTCNYVVIGKGFCFSGKDSRGCGMADLWDHEDPGNKKRPQVCPTLWNNPNPKPFTRVFASDEFIMLKI